MSRKKTNNDLRRYFKEIKSLFPTYGEREKKYFASFKNAVEESGETGSALTVGQLCAQFGEPNTIVSEYLAVADADYLRKRIKTTKYVKLCIAIVALIIVVAVTIEVVMRYQLWLESIQFWLNDPNGHFEDFRIIPERE